MTVTVYTKPGCVQCTATVRRLRAKGIEYVPKDITDPVNLEAAKALGHMEAPVVDVDGESWSGYQPDRIDELAARLEGNN